MESVPVKEQAGSEIIWDGTVEVFELVGHPRATRCYTWIVTPDPAKRRFVTVLHMGLVSSPKTAVKAWLASKTVDIPPVFAHGFDSLEMSETDDTSESMPRPAKAAPLRPPAE